MIATKTQTETRFPETSESAEPANPGRSGRDRRPDPAAVEVYQFSHSAGWERLDGHSLADGFPGRRRIFEHLNRAAFFLPTSFSGSSCQSRTYGESFGLR